MSFIWPAMLWSLLLVPLLILWYVRLQQRHQKTMNISNRLFFTQVVNHEAPGFRRHLPPTFFLTSLAILMVALARPQMVVSLPKVQGTVILAFDVSGSMAATDLRPTRLDAAKAAARDFVTHQPPSVQIGVVAFSDNGYNIQAPTNDQDTVLAAINRMSPQRGTSLSSGIQSALNTIASNQDQGPRLYSNLASTPAPTPTSVPAGTYSSSVIVLLTDGDNNEGPDPLTVAQTAANQGVRIYTIGIGSAAGMNLHINGFTVFTQLDETTLKQISQVTGGSYFNAENAQELQSIYGHLDPQLVIKPEKMEITSLFAGISIFAMLIGGIFSLFWFGRLP